MQEIHDVDLAINWIIGDAKSDNEKLGDLLTKEEKYTRLEEVIQVVNSLLANKGPIAFSGRHFNFINSTLLSKNKRPIVTQFLAGHSSDALRISKENNIKQLIMLSAEYEKENLLNKAVAFGILCEETDEKAIKKARLTFPMSKYSEYHLALSKVNSGSIWKNELYNKLDKEWDVGFSTTPLLSFSETPFFIGSYNRVLDLFRKLKKRGVKDFVITLASESDYPYLNKIKETLCFQID